MDLGPYAEPDDTHYCSNCGSSFPQHTLRYTATGELACPDCGSTEVERIHAAD